MECRHCATGKSYRPDIVALLTKEPGRTFNRASIYNALVGSGAACGQCCTTERIGSMLYHLCQNGTIERLGKGAVRLKRP
jgi:hypothetical protein